MSLLQRAIEAHGGAERWARLGAIEAHLRSSGLAYTMRMRRPVELRLRLDPHRPHNVLLDWPRPGQRGVFERERVRIESAGGEILRQRVDPRAAFRPLRRQAMRWDDLDLLYFAGYASWNYLTTPFLLAKPGMHVQERGGGRLDVTFPPDVPTHSRRQSFWFGDDGLLRRLDYTAEVFGSWAKSVHTCAAHRTFDGIVAPTRRRVVPRGPGERALAGPTLVRIELLDLRPVDR